MKENSETPQKKVATETNSIKEQGNTTDGKYYMVHSSPADKDYPSVESYKRDYSSITKEKIEEFLKDIYYKPTDGRKITAYGYDEQGNLVPIEQTKAFDEAMKREAKKWMIKNGVFTKNDDSNVLAKNREYPKTPNESYPTNYLEESGKFPNLSDIEKPVYSGKGLLQTCQEEAPVYKPMSYRQMIDALRKIFHGK